MHPRHRGRLTQTGNHWISVQMLPLLKLASGWPSRLINKPCNQIGNTQIVLIFFEKASYTHYYHNFLQLSDIISLLDWQKTMIIKIRTFSLTFELFHPFWWSNFESWLLPRTPTAQWKSIEFCSDFFFKTYYSVIVCNIVLLISVSLQ